jgi:hypothetical protein
MGNDLVSLLRSEPIFPIADLVATPSRFVCYLVTLTFGIDCRNGFNSLSVIDVFESHRLLRLLNPFKCSSPSAVTWEFWRSSSSSF